MSIDIALEIAQHNAVTARLPEAGEFGRIADLLRTVVADRDPNANWITLAHGICTNAGIERKACDLCDCTGDIHDQTGEWRGECPYCRPQASAAVPEGVLSIARRMAEEAKEHDHCTAHPVFIVQKRRLVTGIDIEYTDNIAWVSEGEILDATESSALEAAYQETGKVPDDYTRTGYCEEWEHIDTYLTERAALSRCSGAPDYRVTVESAYRNKEMQIVRAFLMSLAASQTEVQS